MEVSSRLIHSKLIHLLFNAYGKSSVVGVWNSIGVAHDWYPLVPQSQCKFEFKSGNVDHTGDEKDRPENFQFFSWFQLSLFLKFMHFLLLSAQFELFYLDFKPFFQLCLSIFSVFDKRSFLCLKRGPLSCLFKVFYVFYLIHSISVKKYREPTYCFTYTYDLLSRIIVVRDRSIYHQIIQRLILWKFQMITLLMGTYLVIWKPEFMQSWKTSESHEIWMTAGEVMEIFKNVKKSWENRIVP